MRGSDGGPWRNICALPALWVGLLYDEQAQRDALDFIQDWTQVRLEGWSGEWLVHSATEAVVTVGVVLRGSRRRGAARSEIS